MVLLISLLVVLLMDSLTVWLITEKWLPADRPCLPENKKPFANPGQGKAKGGVSAVPPLFCRMSGSLIRPLTQAGRKQLHRRKLHMAAIRKYPPASHSVLSFTAPVQKLPSIILLPGPPFSQWTALSDGLYDVLLFFVTVVFNWIALFA